MKVKRKKGFFSISAAAKMFSVHQQTIRLYEKQGLIVPKRSSGNTRLFTEQDIDRLEEIIYLTHELGINLAGVEMILKLKKQIKNMQKEMNEGFDNTQKEIDKQAENYKHTIQANAQRLISLKQEKKQQSDSDIQWSSTDDTINDSHITPVTMDNWEIDYEE